MQQHQHHHHHHHLPGAHVWVHGFAQEGSGDPGKAVDEPVCRQKPRRKRQQQQSEAPVWCSQKQNKGFGGDSLRRGNAVDAMLSDSGTKLHSVFKAELKRHGLHVLSWQNRVEVPASAPVIYHGYAPVLDCLCATNGGGGGGGGGGALVPVEVKACRARKLKRRAAKDKGCRAPFDGFADTYGLRHQLQLCMQNAALGNVKPRGFIAYVDVQAETVSLTKLNKEVWAIAQGAAAATPTRPQ